MQAFKGHGLDKQRHIFEPEIIIHSSMNGLLNNNPMGGVGGTGSSQ